MATPESLLLALANHDQRACFAYHLQANAFVYMNPAFLTLFNPPSSPVSARQLFDSVHPEDQDYLKRIYQELQPGTFKDHIEFRMVLADHKQYTFSMGLLLQEENPDGPILTGYIEDISDYKNHEEKLRDLSNKKNSILNILSHDLSGPLGSIQNFSYLLSKKIQGQEDEQISHIIASIEKISKKCIHMIQDFIKLEFIESVGVELVKTRLIIVERLQVFMSEYLRAENDLKKNFEFECSHPQIYVEIDENKFFQAINNLISNAMKFTPDGGNISIRLDQQEDALRITIADNGIGIPEKFHEHLFEKFSEARRTGLKGEPSVGLGMSIIKTIVEWHQGKISFKSTEGQGTTFYIEIPTVA